MKPSPGSILVRGVNWLGDAVMTTPALRRLREAFPESEITLLTPAKLAPIWEGHPALNRVLPVPDGATPWAASRLARRVKADWAVILPNSPRSALECFLAGIPRRSGYERPWRNWLLTERVPPRRGEVPMRKKRRDEVVRLTQGEARPASESWPDRAHHIFQYLDLVAALGASGAACAPYLAIGEEEAAQLRQTLIPSPEPVGGWAGLNPGAEYGPAKRWPLPSFVEAAKELYRLRKCGWLVFGGAADRPLTFELARLLRESGVSPVMDLAGQTSLRQLGAVLKRCRVVLTNDTGPMHMAAALGTPVVALFGSTSPALTGPGDPSRSGSNRALSRAVPCAPCFLRECPIDFRCMTTLGPRDVVEAANRLMGGEKL